MSDTSKQPDALPPFPDAPELRQGEPVAWRYKGAGWERWIYCTDPPRNPQHEYIVEPLYASPPPAQPTQAEPACGCRIGECESKPPPLVCRMTEEIKRGES